MVLALQSLDILNGGIDWLGEPLPGSMEEHGGQSELETLVLEEDSEWSAFMLILEATAGDAVC